MEALYEATLNQITEKEVMSGTVVGITDRDVIVNIGFKSDGLVSLSEFRDIEGLKTGDTVDVYVEEQENANGQLVLSRRKAKIVKAWENIQKALDEDLVIDGMVKRRTKGGLIVDIYGVEAFLPGSQIDVKPIRDFDVFVGKKMEVKVVKINYTNDNVVVSHKVLIEKDIEKQKAQILENLEKGQVLEGVIKNIYSNSDHQRTEALQASSSEPSTTKQSGEFLNLNSNIVSSGKCPPQKLITPELGGYNAGR